MVVPSFARATASSTLKASSQGGASKDVKTPTKTQSPGVSLSYSTSDKKLKRPSTLTRRVRQSIAYNADLYYIKSSTPSKPCPLADLPSELRTQIYAHVFGDLQRPILMNYGRIRHSPSVLLHICRAIRIEAAYVYFPEASFTWIVNNLNFSTVIRWLQSLQPSHRSLLSRNQNLTIEIIPGLSKSFTYPPKDFLLDNTLQNHWRACQPFGNLYSVKGKSFEPRGVGYPVPDDPRHNASRENMRLYFVLFCRLAAWSTLCTQPGYTKIKWKYTFDMPSDNYGVSSWCTSIDHHEADIHFFLVQLERLWTRNQCESRIKGPVLELVDAFIKAFTQMVSSSSRSSTFQENSFPERLMAQRSRIEKWDRRPLM